MDRLGIIIVSWNVRELLSCCLTTLQQELKQSQVEAKVWVVDNASADSSAAMVREDYPWVYLEPLDENLGYVRGNNLVLKRMLRGDMPDLVWLLNPDTEIRPGAITALQKHFAKSPKAGLAGPKLLNPDGTLQSSAFHFPGLLQALFDLGWLPRRFYGTRLNGRYTQRQYASGKAFRVSHPLGAAMMARGTAIKDVGPLDEHFFMYCEEIDWAWRMRKAGWQAWLVPQAEVVHYGGASTDQIKPQTTAYLWQSRAHLYQKHHTCLTQALVRAIVRQTFAKKAAPSPEWKTAYQNIIEAW